MTGVTVTAHYVSYAVAHRYSVHGYNEFFSVVTETPYFRYAIARFRLYVGLVFSESNEKAIEGMRLHSHKHTAMLFCSRNYKADDENYACIEAQCDEGERALQM